MSDSKKTILIFGGGINQLELIREAGKLGIITVVADPLPDPPGKAEADFFYQLAGNDYDATRAVARKHKVNGIVTGQMEKPLPLMSRLAEEEGYIFNSPAITGRSMDKWLMKKAFAEHNVPAARGILLNHGETLPQQMPEWLSFPMIIKPRDAFSSRGVYKVSSTEDIMAHMEETRYFASDGGIIIEEFLDGKEYSVEAVTYRGHTTIIQFTEKFITPYPNTVEMGHLQPAALDDRQRSSVEKAVRDALSALEIDNCASHTEVMLTTQGPMIIETGARLGGDFIASYLTKASTGVSMDRAAVQVALGIKPDLDRKQDRYAMVKYAQLTPGVTVREVLPVDDITAMPGVVFAHIFISPGETVKHITHSALRPGCVIVTAENRNELRALADRTIELLLTKIKF